MPTASFQLFTKLCNTRLHHFLKWYVLRVHKSLVRVYVRENVNMYCSESGVQEASCGQNMNLGKISSFLASKMEASSKAELYTSYDCSEIIPNLFLGNLQATSNADLLDKLGIKCILSVYDGVLRVIHEGIKYRKITVADTAKTDLLSELDRAHRIIKTSMDNDEPVLVHCRMGVSRSATVVIAYLMKERKLTYDKAKSLVQQMRPMINPNPGFSHQLDLYEEMDCSLLKPNGEFKRLYRNVYHGLTGKFLSQTSSFNETQGKGSPSEALDGEEDYDPHPGDVIGAVPSDPGIMLSKDSVLKCRFCRSTVDARPSEPENHHSPVCVVHVEPEEWISKGELKGKIHCPICNVKLGRFDWAGGKCGCGEYVTPWFSIIPSKVDLC